LGAAAATVAVIVVVLLLRASGSDDREPKVVLYGDSLSSEAREAFVARLTPGAHVVTRVFAGTAICDWLEDIRRDVKHPADVAVLEFLGNDLTPCARGPGGEQLTGDALVARYTRDADTATRLLTAVGTDVYWVSGPRVGAPGAIANTAFRELYRRTVVPGHEGPPPITGTVRFIDAGRAVLGPGGVFTPTLPCLPSEGAARGCVDGQIVVRAPDGVHFCPVATRAGVCPVYSSGAARFGRAMADPVARALGL
jgi:hypothetical protein